MSNCVRNNSVRTNSEKSSVFPPLQYRSISRPVIFPSSLNATFDTPSETSVKHSQTRTVFFHLIKSWLRFFHFFFFCVFLRVCLCYLRGEWRSSKHSNTHIRFFWTRGEDPNHYERYTLKSCSSCCYSGCCCYQVFETLSLCQCRIKVGAIDAAALGPFVK